MMLSTCACTRDVERRRRFVADQELGLRGQRARDRDALALPARELVRELLRVGGGQSDRPSSSPTLARISSGIDGRRRGRVRGSARRRCRAPSSAGSGSRTGPGRSSACAGAACASSAGSRLRTSTPSKRTLPRVGRVQAHQQPRHGGLLPQPDSPTSGQRFVPLRISKLTPSTACTNWRGLRSITRLSQGADTSKIVDLPRSSTCTSGASGQPSTHACSSGLQPAGRTRGPGIGIRFGRSVRQRSNTFGQRGLKAQPAGSRSAAASHRRSAAGARARCPSTGSNP